MLVIAKGKLNFPTLSGEPEDHGIVRRPQGSMEVQQDRATRRLEILATRGSDRPCWRLPGRAVWRTGGGAGRSNIPLLLTALWHCTCCRTCSRMVPPKVLDTRKELTLKHEGCSAWSLLTAPSPFTAPLPARADKGDLRECPR